MLVLSRHLLNNLYISIKGSTLPLTDTAVANINLNPEWLTIPVFTSSELELALRLTIDLRGTPEYWTAVDEGMVLIRDHTTRFEAEGRGFHPFISTPDATSLARDCWDQLVPLNALIVSDGEPWLIVRIPRQPDMGGIGGWNDLQLLFWQCSPCCIIITGAAIRAAS